MKNNLPLIIFAVGSLFLTACVQLTEFNKPASTQTQECLQMKREMMFRSNDPNHDAKMVTRAQQQAYTARYKAICG